MHGSSSSSQRPRQRTSTSCTECRRRKQKCNQAKDRPCNNCCRRYPPVVCTYDSGSSRGSTAERVDLQDEDGHPNAGVSADGTSYGSGSYASGGYTGASDEQYDDSAQAYYSPVQTTTAYYPQQDQSWSGSTQYAGATAGAYDSAYYGSGTAVSGQTYGVAAGYSASYTGYNQAWSPDADPRAFAGTENGYDALNNLPVEYSRRNAELSGAHHARP